MSFSGNQVVLSAQIKQTDAQIDLISEQLARLQIIAPFDGVVIEGDLDQLLAYVIGNQQTTLRTIIPQAEIGLLTRVKKVYVRLANRLHRPLDATVSRITPAA